MFVDIAPLEKQLCKIAAETEELQKEVEELRDIIHECDDASTMQWLIEVLPMLERSLQSKRSELDAIEQRMEDAMAKIVKP